MIRRALRTVGWVVGGYLGIVLVIILLLWIAAFTIDILQLSPRDQDYYLSLTGFIGFATAYLLGSFVVIALMAAMYMGLIVIAVRMGLIWHERATRQHLPTLTNPGQRSALDQVPLDRG